jgi:hypothetical protein
MDTVHPKMQMNLLKDKNNINQIHRTPKKRRCACFLLPVI